jgi:dihydroorotate dehydrogenase (NAD+) catalytic subunit
MPGIIERNFKASQGYQSMTGTRPPFGPSDAEELIDKLHPGVVGAHVAPPDEDEVGGGRVEGVREAREIVDHEIGRQLDPPARRAQHLGDARGEGAEVDAVGRVDQALEREALGIGAEAVAVGAGPQLEVDEPLGPAQGLEGGEQFFDVAALGAVVTKSIMLEPRSGRPTPRMAETPSGMLNSIGLQGPGIDAFLETDLPWLHEKGARAVVSVAGGSVEEYAELARRLRGAPGLAAVEVNISCPNVADRGLVFACDPRASAAVVAAVRRETAPSVPVVAKLSPDVTDIVAIARSCVDAGADGLSMINTLLGMAIDPDTMRPVLGGVTGGLSGPAVRPVAVRCVWQVHAAMPHVPIIGMGGVRSGLDALELVLAGASAVSVGTAVFGDPGAPARVLKELRHALVDRGFPSVRDAVGHAHRPLEDPSGPPPTPRPSPSPWTPTTSRRPSAGRRRPART